MSDNNKNPVAENPSVTEPPRRENILLNWIIVVAVIAVIMLAAKYLPDILGR